MAIGAGLQLIGVLSAPLWGAHRDDPEVRALYRRGHLGDILAKEGRLDQAAVEWEKSLAEWHRSLPADMESDKVAEMEKKLGQGKHRVAQKSSAAPDNKQP